MMVLRSVADSKRRATPGGDEGAAMLTALFAILLTATFSIIMLGVLMSQITPTQLQRATTRTVFAAESGINAAVGQIRNAEGSPDVQGHVYGKRSLLPCTVVGSVTSAGTEVGYTATVRYYLQNPTSETETWRASHAIACTPGHGPSSDPAFALITSEGSGLSVPSMSEGVSRTMEVVYAFRVTNTNIPGGRIYSWDKTIAIDRFCLEATDVAVGAKIRYVASVECASSDTLQMWIYDTDYRIKLASTTIPAYGGTPLCITATPNGATPVEATLQECKPVADPSRWNQLWSWTGGASWNGQQDPISNGYSSYFLSSGSKATVVAGTTLKVWNQRPADAEWSSFDPAPSVGAGAAGSNTHQLVNYEEFGRCADVTHGQLGESQMIVYPCKQDPDPAQTRLAWNHKWYFNEPPLGMGSTDTQPIYVLENNTTKYCLVSPGPGGGFVHFTIACNPAEKSQQWVRQGDTGNYDTSYVFVDGYGKCLSLGPWYMQGTGKQEAWSTMVTSTCSPSLSQKWNAKPNPVPASLSGYWEVP